jgi:dienelactone hydrolase
MKQRVSLLIFFVLAACSTTPAVNPPATLSAIIVPDTPTPTVLPLPTATRTTEQALYPYTIEGLRKHKFQSGKITVGESVFETEDFVRYPMKYPSDGLIITGILQVPKVGKPPYPVIVMNHGFFSRTIYKSGDGTDRAAEFLNRHGYLTVSSDYRSWGDAQTGESLYYSGLAIDVINLMNSLPSYSQADTERMGMWGHSMGGGTTLKVLTIDKRIKAAVLYSPVSADFADIIERWGPGCIGDVLEGEAAYGCNSSDILPLSLPGDLITAYSNSVNDPKMLKEVSPLFYFDYVNTPIQINYGTEDGKVSSGTPPEWSKKMYKGLIDAGKDAQLFAFAGEKHSFRDDQWFAFMERTAQFFDKYVK